MGASAAGCGARGRPEACRSRRCCRRTIHPTGFTLVELLVVIAAIALLMAILVPVLSRARKYARATVCLSHLKQWGMVFALYTQDSEGHLPPDSVDALWLLRGAYRNQAGPNEPPVLYHVSTKGILYCPMATQPAERMGGFRFTKSQVLVAEGTTGGALGAWEVTGPMLPFRGSYGLNGSLERNLLSVKGMARIPVLLDAAMAITSAAHPTDMPPPNPSLLLPGMGAFCLDRHDAQVNGVFLDWSVRRIGLKELWTLKWSRNFDTAGRWTKAGGVKPEQWPQWMRGMKDY